LLLVWLGLMSFGVISAVNPGWLQELSRPGIDTEALNYKKFADDHLRHGKVRLAIGQYLYALEIKPDLTGALVNLAVAYRRVGAQPRGIHTLRTALEQETRSPGIIYYNLGELLEKQGKPEEALRAYRQAIEVREAINPGVEIHHMYFKLGSLFYTAGELARAREAFAAALANIEDPAASYLEMLRRSLGIYREDAEILPVVEAELARESGEIDLAVYDLETIRLARERDPRNAQVLRWLGRVEARLGNLAAAVEHLERAAALQPGDSKIKSDLAAVRRHLAGPGGARSPAKPDEE